MRGKMRLGKKALAKKTLRAFGYGRGRADGRIKAVAKSTHSEASRCEYCEYAYFPEDGGEVICEFSGACKNK